MLYFDHNATTPLLAAAREAWLDAADRYAGNPSSPHRIGQRADQALQQARERLGAHLQCDPLDIVWTSGATESANTFFHHLAAAGTVGEIWISAIEHPCVLSAASHYLKKIVRMPVTMDGVLDLNWMNTKLRDSVPAAVAVMAANNETGILQPWQDIAELCRARHVSYFCDAAQWIGKLPAKGLGAAEFVSGAAHKFGGPKGVGFLKCPAATRPLLVGGKQEDGRRAGTENVAGVLSMMAALDQRQQLLDAGEHDARLVWRESFERQLVANLPGHTVVGAKTARLWNTVSVVMPEADCRQRWVVRLDREGYAVSTGSACASGREEPSHVLAAMGFTAAEAGRVLRFSSGWETEETDWNALLAGLVKVISTTNVPGEMRSSRGDEAANGR